MSGYDYRIRRNVFRSKRIEKYQNFQSLQDRYRSGRRMQSLARFLLILIALVVLIGFLIFTANATQKKPVSPKMEDHSELTFKIIPDRL